MSYRQKSVKELFSRFNLDPSCSKTELRNQYLRRARKLHPDTSRGDSSRFVEMKEEYEAALKYIHSRESNSQFEGSTHQHVHRHDTSRNQQTFYHDGHFKYNYGSSQNWHRYTDTSNSHNSQEVKEWEKWIVFSVFGVFVFILYEALWPSRRALSPINTLQDMTLRQAHDAMRMGYTKSEFEPIYAKPPPYDTSHLQTSHQNHEDFYKHRVTRSTVKNSSASSRKSG